jgi:23S rRNA (guanosine2251-2'-O)-methyltransferase
VQQAYLQSGAKFDAELHQALKVVSSTEMDREQMELITAGQNHQGVCLVLEPRKSLTLDELAGLSLSETGNKLLVVLDQVVDPHNFGAVLRAAETSGVDGVIITKNHSAGLTPTVRKVSAGASELVPVVDVNNLQRTFELLKAKGFWVAGLCLPDLAQGIDAKCLYQTELPSPLVIVLGAEGSGLRQLTRSSCDLLVEIPMRGKLQSLNVSQAAAAVLFEVMRQRNYS